MSKFEFEAIGFVQSPFKEKFGIPRQPGLVAGAVGVLKLRDEDFIKQAIREIDGFSHLWLVFVFHEHGAKNWKPSIRPPRLGGAKKVGVLASRSPHRPNPIGLSAVKLLEVRADAPGGAELVIEGVDLLDGTPVLDIKPYIPYADSIPDAKAGWAEEPIIRTPVDFSDKAVLEVAKRMAAHPDLRRLIEEMLTLDPRPAFQKRRAPAGSPEAEGLTYGFKLFDYDVKWRIEAGRFVVIDVIDL